MEVLSAPGTARIEEEMARDRFIEQKWWAEHWYELDPEIESSEIISPNSNAASEEYLPSSNVPNWMAQPLELLHEWRGRKHMVDDLSAIILCVEIRWSYVPPIGEDTPCTWLYTGHGPWGDTRRTPSTIRNIPARTATGSVRSLAVKLPSAKRDHTPAGSGAARIEHDCHNWCDCWKDWLPFVHWRPWNDPPEAEIQHWAENLQPHGLLSDYLTKLLWEHRQTEPQKPGEFYKDWRSVQYFPLPHLGRTVDRVYMWPQGVLNVPRTGPRMQQEQRYVKAWWQFFRKSAESQKPQKGALSDVICSPFGKVPTRISVDVAYTIVKKDPCAEEVPYYQKHDSDEDVAAFFNCSRATAFRRIKEGFRIPEELRTVTTAPLATTAYRLNLGVLAGGGYMKLTPAVENIPRGSTESRPGDR